MLPTLCISFAMSSAAMSVNWSSMTTPGRRALAEVGGGGVGGGTGTGPMCSGNADPGPYSLDNYICLAGTLKPDSNTIQGADDATCCIADNACPFPERCLEGGGCLEGTAGIGCATCAPGTRH